MNDPSLHWMTRNAAAHAVMIGCGETAVAAYAVLLGASHTQIALLATLPFFAGALAQMGAVSLLDGRRSRRALTSGFATAQGFSWALIFLLPLAFPLHAAGMLVVAAVVTTVFGHMNPPIWNSWVGDLLPPGMRGVTFGKNGRVAALFNLLGLLAGALILEAGVRTGHPVVAFGVVFAAAMAARLVSAHAHRQMTDLAYPTPRDEDHFSLWDFLRRSPRSNFARFVFFAAAMHGTSYFAGPFFTPHMLRDLKFTYPELFSTHAVYFIAQFLTMHRWGALCDRIGNRAVLRITTAFLPLFPLFWLISSRLPVILVVQSLAGCFWGGFNLAAGNFLFDAVTPAKRARCQAYFNLFQHAGMLVGGLFGGLIAPHVDGLVSLGAVTLSLAWPIHTIFLMSSLMRILPARLLLPAVEEVRPVETHSAGAILRHMSGTEPLPAKREPHA